MSEEKRCAQCGAVLAADAPQGRCRLPAETRIRDEHRWG